MNLTLSLEQKMLKDSANKFFNESFNFDQRRKHLESNNKYNLDFTNKMSSLGWLGLPFSSSLNGYDGSSTDIMVLMECFGESLSLYPYISNILFVGKFIENVLSAELQKKYIPKIIDGSYFLTFAFSEPTQRFNHLNIQAKIEKINDKIILKGKKNFILGLDIANELIVPVIDASNDEINIIKLPINKNDMKMKSYKSIDDNLITELELEGTCIKKEQIIARLKKDIFIKKLDYIIDFCALAYCSDSLGAIEKMYQLTLDYVKTREQFGKKIGSFQVIQHRLVDIFIKKEEMRSLNYMGQISLEKDENIRKKSISLNKIFLGTHAREIAKECIQLHGGMGVAEEMQIGHYLKRILTANTIYGDSDYHYSRYAKLD